jgi:hypothetical protein
MQDRVAPASERGVAAGEVKLALQLSSGPDGGALGFTGGLQPANTAAEAAEAADNLRPRRPLPGLRGRAFTSSLPYLRGRLTLVSRTAVQLCEHMGANDDWGGRVLWTAPLPPGLQPAPMAAAAGAAVDAALLGLWREVAGATASAGGATAGAALAEHCRGLAPPRHQTPAASDPRGCP